MANGMSPMKRARFLVNGSVGDLVSGLPHYNVEDIDVIKLGIRICKRRNEKTKIGHLQRKLKKLGEELKAVRDASL
jgi:hypothetical protein